jgi:hypothetical protein
MREMGRGEGVVRDQGSRKVVGQVVGVKRDEKRRKGGGGFDEVARIMTPFPLPGSFRTDPGDVTDSFRSAED